MRKLLFLLGSTLALSALTLADTSAPSFTDFEADLVEYQGGAAGAIAMYSAALDAVDKTYETIKKIFGSTESTTLVEKVTKLSFSEFSSSAVIRKFQGVLPENLPKIRTSVTRSAEVPAEKQADFADFFDLIDIQDSSSFQTQTTGYTKDSLGNAKYLTLLSMVDPDTGKYTVITVDVKATFQVAEDLYLWNKKSS